MPHYVMVKSKLSYLRLIGFKVLDIRKDVQPRIMDREVCLQEELKLDSFYH